MAKIVREELWKHPGHPGLIVVTTNATIGFSNGRLVMGCGAALQAKQRIPGIDRECARVIQEATRSIWSYPAPHGEMALEAYYNECAAEDNDPYSREYHFQVIREPSPDEGKVGFGIFQVKPHFRQPADLGLIYRSTVVLEEYAELHPSTSIRMNYPGIGAGGLSRGDVEHLLTGLPSNITICYR